MMKFHQITGGRPKVVAAVTIPERLRRAASRTFADRVWDGYQWYESPNGYDIGSVISPVVVVTFSDDTIGLVNETALESALAAFDVSLELEPEPVSV